VGRILFQPRTIILRALQSRVPLIQHRQCHDVRAIQRSMDWLPRRVNMMRVSVNSSCHN
jgi:hypothetical protein